MHDQSLKRPKNLLGYLFLIGLTVFFASTYQPRVSPLNFLPELLMLAAAIAIITMTISVFWLWKEERVEKLEKAIGMLGHVPHCSYCLSLWLCALATNLLGISLFGFLGLPPLVNFFLSWWALSFFAIVLFGIVAVLWFKKLKMESEIRDREQNRNLTEH